MPVIHGGTDAGPPVRFDLSTNANPLGPSPFAMRAMQAPISAYPDPSYAATRHAIAHHTGFSFDEIVVGAGATELIYRVVLARSGPVQYPVPGFGEYGGAADLFHRSTTPFPGHPQDGEYTLIPKGVAFITQPGSPDGLWRDNDWCEQLQDDADHRDTWIVWDMAYAPLCAPSVIHLKPFSEQSILLFAPNKAHGCTGLRAGWLRAPKIIAEQLRALQMSWICSTPGEQFLREQASSEADSWVTECNITLQRMGERLATVLSQKGWPTHKGHTPWILTKPKTPTSSQTLRSAFGVQVRDLTSQGMPGWWRIGVPHPDDLDTVLTIFNDLP
ncbi:aminotransferase class I/II-fold pyridoxal phosphate-dependent enzyme [Stomatohabitans albus]|uniref:aminotransferase class I/II-fold pyridoxal phosphate-dependent enzyme n=1 Tax=Stomatohabitans albus TaxID=3110766 RepID=UPI00300C6ABD